MGRFLGLVSPTVNKPPKNAVVPSRPALLVLMTDPVNACARPMADRRMHGSNWTEP
jgi:hypothetical protein